MDYDEQYENDPDEFNPKEYWGIEYEDSLLDVPDDQSLTTRKQCERIGT